VFQPDDTPLDLDRMSADIIEIFAEFKSAHGYAPRMYMESGRWITGPHGALITRAINHKSIYRQYVGVDACMSSLMRPGMYEAYHHIDVIGRTATDQREVYDVVGSLCENNDKFAIQRSLPPVHDGDLLAIHDTGAHGHAMGFQYNGRLRPKELLLHTDGSVELIRRAETNEDYFRTLDFEADVFPAE
jgi:diaminopimelate decarboxylase